MKNACHIPERMTAANSPWCLSCTRHSAESLTNITFQCKPASHPRTTTLSPQDPHLSCFSTYLLLFSYDMFQAGNHEFRSQGTESEPCTTGLQSRDDLWQIVTDEAKSGIFSKFLNHWQKKRKPPHIHSHSSQDPEVLNFSMVTWRVQETRMQQKFKNADKWGCYCNARVPLSGGFGLESAILQKMTNVSPQDFIKRSFFYDSLWFWCSCHPIPWRYEIQCPRPFACNSIWQVDDAPPAIRWEGVALPQSLRAFSRQQ